MVKCLCTFWVKKKGKKSSVSWLSAFALSGLKKKGKKSSASWLSAFALSGLKKKAKNQVLHG